MISILVAVSAITLIMFKDEERLVPWAYDAEMGWNEIVVTCRENCTRWVLHSPCINQVTSSIFAFFVRHRFVPRLVRWSRQGIFSVSTDEQVI